MGSAVTAVPFRIPALAQESSMSELIHPGLPFPLTAHGGLPTSFELDEAGVLRVTGAAHTDLFLDPSGQGRAPDAGYFLGEPPVGDFTLSARVTVPFQSMFDAGVLLLHVAGDRFAKLCFEYSPQRRPSAVSVVTRGVSDDSNSFPVEGNTLWLRVTRVGAAWAFHASTDGKWWDLMRYFSLQEDGAPVRVGLLAQSPMGDGITVTFDQLAFHAGAPADLRDGS